MDRRAELTGTERVMTMAERVSFLVERIETAVQREALVDDGGAALIELVAEIARDWGVVLASLGRDPEPGRPYGRRLLAAGGGCELMIASWGVGSRSAPHDHGEARGLVAVLEGNFVERTWSCAPSIGVRDAVVSEPTVSAVRRAGRGDVLPVDVGVFHDLGGVGTTLHVYRPAPSHVRLLDPARRRILVVDAEAGAWFPVEAKSVRSVEPAVSGA